MHDDRIDKLRVHEENLKKIESYDLSNPSYVYEAQKFLEKCFNDVIGDFKNTKDKLLVFMIYYDLTAKKEFNYLRPFYKQTYERCFDTEVHMQEYFDLLQNKELCDSVLENVNDETLKNIYNYTKDINDLFLKNNDQKYVGLYKKIEKVCLDKNIIEPPFIIKAENFDTEEVLKKSHDENKLSDLSYEAQQTGKMSENFTNAANAIGVEPDKLIDLVGEKNALKVDEIEVSKKFLDKLAANSTVITTIPNNKLMNLVSRINRKNTLKSVDFDIVEINGVNRLLLNREDTTLDKIANCSKNVLKAIKGKVSKIKKLSSIIEKVKPSIVKEAIVNTNSKVDNYLANLRNKEKSTTVEYEDVYSDSSMMPNANEASLDDLYKMTQEMDRKDANKVIEKATVNPNLNPYDFANNVAGVTHMEQRQRNDWANESAFATMSDEELSDYNEKARLAAEKAKAEEIVRGRSR